VRYAPGQLERETLETLEWSAISGQVASFTSTPLGDAVVRSGLQLGATQAESERLLRLTAQAVALDARLDFSGVADVRDSVEAASRGDTLAGDALVRIGTTLAAAARLSDTLRGAAPEGQLGDSVALADDLGAQPAGLAAVLLLSLSVPGGNILDAASPELADVRAHRRETGKQLRALLQATSAKLVAQGAADAAQVVSRRSRLCVPVKRGMSGLLPGSVVLDSSFSGATLFVEPPEGTKLNNLSAALDARHEELEKAILEALSGQVRDGAAALRRCIAAVAALDCACARARHGVWLGATALPVFCAAAAAAAPEVQVLHASHPLLLGTSLPPAPLRWWELEAAQAAAEAAALATLPGAAPDTSSSTDTSSGGAESGQDDSSHPHAAAPPVPVDWRIPGGVRCVVITGANTGGKTASMKTLALCCLLARAGCFVPAAGDQPPRLPWVHSVLADMGDGQSLSSGLSTFGGHVARLSAILQSCRPRKGSEAGRLALVLLDEPGAGTDPEEGTALACAFLAQLATCNALTVATSHYDGVKRLAEQPLDNAGAGQPWCLNAAVEFDEASLRPTFRLLWNATGKSYAINAAIRAGLPQRVIDTSKALMRSSQQAEIGSSASQQQLKAPLAETLAKQLHEATASALAAEEARRRAEAEADELTTRAAAHTTRQKPLIATAESDARAAEAAARAAFAEAVAAPDPEAALAAALGTHLPAGWQYAGGASGAVRRTPRDGEAVETASAWVPAVGELVRVAGLGTRRAATVVDVSGQTVTVRMGALTSHVSLADVRPNADDDLLDGLEEEGSDTSSSGRKPSQAAARRLVVPRISRSAGAAQDSQFMTPRAASSEDADALAAIPGVSTEQIDVRGMYATQAVAAVEAAIQARGQKRGASVMRVVHGVGTGKVKQAVTDYLRTCAMVAKMQPAAPRDGGAGCTVIVLR
jgi:DNA mismatch repair protein MutS2